MLLRIITGFNHKKNITIKLRMNYGFNFVRIVILLLSVCDATFFSFESHLQVDILIGSKIFQDYLSHEWQLEGIRLLK